MAPTKCPVDDRLYAFDLLCQGGVGTRCDPKFNRRSEYRTLMRLPEVVQRHRHRIGGRLHPRDVANRGLRALLGEVLDGGDDEVFLRAEVVDLCTPRHTGEFDDAMRRRARVAVLDQTLHGRIEQSGAHVRAALRLSAPDDARIPARGHRRSLLAAQSSSQETFQWTARCCGVTLRRARPWRFMRDRRTDLASRLAERHEQRHPCSQRVLARLDRMPHSAKFDRAASRDWPTTYRSVLLDESLTIPMVGGAAKGQRPRHAVAPPQSHAGKHTFRIESKQS